MRMLLCLAVLFFIRSASVAQVLVADEIITRTCGFRSPTLAAARTFISTSFDSLRFAPGERIADIGAQSGNLAGIFSLFYDNLDMTLEDIDSSCLSAVTVRATMRHYYGLREREWPKNFRTHIVIGTETSTLLPDAAYTKVFFMNTFHEVAEKGPILAELYRITAPGGTLYVTERVSTTKRMKRKDCGHGMPLERELVADFSRAGYKLERTKTTERWKQKSDVVKRMSFVFRKA